MAFRFPSVLIALRMIRDQCPSRFVRTVRHNVFLTDYFTNSIIMVLLEGRRIPVELIVLRSRSLPGQEQKWTTVLLPSF